MNEYLLCYEGICKVVELQTIYPAGDPGASALATLVVFITMAALGVFVFWMLKRKDAATAMLSEKLKLTHAERDVLKGL